MVPENIRKDVENLGVVGTYGDEPVPPTPGSLTPFEVGQTISGYDFGDVSNGDVSAEINAFLAGLTYDGGSNSTLVTGLGNSYLLFATDLSAFGGSGYALIAVIDSGDQGACPVYCTEDNSQSGTPMTITLGWQNLTDGKIMSNITLPTISTIYDTTPPSWNGILVGAVGAGPAPSTLTPFVKGQNINNGDYAVFDTTISNEDSFLSRR